jgi:hypothetical protein
MAGIIQQLKAKDESTLLFDAAITAWWSIGNTDSTAVDLGTVGDPDERDAGEVVVQIPGMTSGGSATVLLVLLDCDTVGGSYAALTPVGVTTAAIAYDDAVWANPIRLPLPKYGVRQFIKLRVTVATANLTAGTLTASFVKA